MGFMTRHRAIDTVDVTDLADPDGNEYWVKLRPLSGEEWEEADAAQTQVRAQMSQNAGAVARAELQRRKARRAAGLPPEEGEDEDSQMQTLIHIDTPAYRALVIDHCLVDWNLTDEYDRPMVLDPSDAKAREASIRVLPDDLRDRIVDWAEAHRSSNRTAAEEAAFRGALPDGGADGALGQSADSGAVASGDMVVARWADDRAGVGDLHPA